jgi:hypothetical protein
MPRAATTFVGTTFLILLPAAALAQQGNIADRARRPAVGAGDGPAEPALRPPVNPIRLLTEGIGGY